MNAIASVAGLPLSNPQSGAGMPSLDLVAGLLDSRWRLPGTGIRFGADAVLSLIPAAGPVISTVLSGYLIWEAQRLGTPRGLLLRMIANVGIDAAISSVPLVGAIGDVFFRANRRNMALLRRHLDRRATGAGTQPI